MLQITPECYKKPGDNALVAYFWVENHHSLQEQMEHFLHRLELYPQGFLKEICSLVCDGTGRKQVKIYKTKHKHKMIKKINVSYYPIQYEKN